MPKFDFVGDLLTDEETDVLQLRRRGWRNVGTLLAYIVPSFFVQLRKKERCRWHTGKST